MLSSVDLPLPMAPTIEMNSPRSTDSDTSRSTGRNPLPAGNDLVIPATSMYANGSDRPQFAFGISHQPVEHEPDEADGQNREQDVRIDQAVVFLPEEPADARRPGQHLAGDDDEPGDAEAEPVTREHVGQCRRHDDLQKRRR